MADTVLQQRVKELAEKHGSIRAAARVLMVDHAYLYRLSTGEKDNPDDDLLRRLKLRRVVSYVRTDTVAEDGYRLVGHADFHMSATYDLVIGTALYAEAQASPAVDNGESEAKSASGIPGGTCCANTPDAAGVPVLPADQTKGPK